MKLTSKIRIALIALLVLALTVTGVTVAYLLASAPSVENEFEPVFVSCLVEGEESQVTVKNTGDVKAYIRAAVIVNWVSVENGNVYSVNPTASDYTLALGTSGWTKGSDGYYYYVAPIAAGDSTAELFSTITPLVEAPDGYELRATVLASAVQAEPTDAVTAFWRVTVLANGELSVQ